MNDCIVISDGEEETHRRSGTTINDEPTDYSSTMSCVPEFVSVPSASSSNMISELESDDIPKPNMESQNISMVPKIAPCNFIEISKSELKKNIRKNDVVIKIDGKLNHTNINAIMSVIQMYNFKNARQIFFVRSSNPNEDINVNDLMCREKLDPLSEQEKSIPQPFQKVEVFRTPNNLKTQAACNQQKTVVNQKPQRVLTGTAVPQAKHQKNQEIVSNLNVLHPNTQNIYNGLKLKPFDQICRTSQPVVETAVAGVSYDPLECALPPNNLNEFSERKQKNSQLLHQLLVEKYHKVIETAINSTYNESTQQNSSKVSEDYPKKLKYRGVNWNGNTESKNNDHMNYVPQPNVLNEFSEKPQADSNLQEARTNYEHNPKKFKYCRVNRNGNTETKNNDHMNYVPQPNVLNEFSEKTQTEDRTNYEPTLQSPSSLNSWSQSLLKTKYCSVIRNERKRKKMVQGKKCVKQAAKDISKMQFQLSSHYITKYQLKEARVSLSRSEVENYFKKMELRKSLSFSEQNTSSNVNQIFIDDYNFASMTHYHCDETPPNTQIYFVNKHNIITSLYMNNFPLFKRAIKTNKIQVISESTYRKYRPVQDNKLTGSLNRFETKLKTHNFCKVVSDFHRTMSDMQNPFLKSIKLDHSYSVGHNMV